MAHARPWLAPTNGVQTSNAALRAYCATGAPTNPTKITNVLVLPKKCLHQDDNPQMPTRCPRQTLMDTH